MNFLRKMIYMNKKITTIVALAGIIALLLPFSVSSKALKKDDWQIRNNLVNRLSGEWYKINILRGELDNINSVLNDLRDIELFPANVIKCSDDSLVAFDRRLEICEKKCNILQKQINSLQNPLLDALSIMHEMIVGKPVEDMFFVLEQDNIKRITQMFTIKHQTDSLWMNVESLIYSLAGMLGIKILGGLKYNENLAEDDFFEILRANLGEQVDYYLSLVNNIKDSLILRAKEEDINKMYQIETNRIKEYLTNSLSINKIDKKINKLRNRYINEQHQNELNFLLIKAFYNQNAFDSILNIANKFSKDNIFYKNVLLYKIEALYHLQKYDEIWLMYKNIDFKSFNGMQKNLLIWMVMQSGLFLDKNEEVRALAQFVEKEYSYNIHVMHALALSYIKAKNYDMALSILENSLSLKTILPLDFKAAERIKLSIAQTYYEKGKIDKALTLFFKILNSENQETFADALYGISWCYIRLGMFKNAENSLQKLINQAPQSPWAVDAIITLGKRRISKAQFEWEKAVYIDNSKTKLKKLKEKINSKLEAAKTKETKEKLLSSLTRVNNILESLEKEKKANFLEIQQLYEDAFKLTELIQKYYATGTFQEVSFTDNREKLLYKVDSVISNIKNNQSTNRDVSFAKDLQIINNIKKMVLKARVLGAEVLIDRYKWENEYINWQKSKLAAELEELNEERIASLDSADIKKLFERKNSINKKIDSLVVIGDKKFNYWYDKITAVCSELVTLPLEPQDEIYLRYHLAEMHYLYENEKYSREYAEYEKAYSDYEKLMELFREGKRLVMPVKPTEPVLSHELSMAQYKYLLEKYPSNYMEYAIRYSFAWCLNDIRKFDEAVTQMDTLVKSFPDCQYAPQAYMYIGEYMFDRAKLDKALIAYQSVLNYPESEWFDKALYKLAWTQYRLSNPEKAISSFLALVDLGDKSAQTKTLLKNESIDYIAISFSETDITGGKGLERATNFVKKFGDESKGTQILHRLAKIYKDQGRYDMSQKTYRTLLRMYPNYSESPVVESELLAVMEKNSTAEETNTRNIDYYRKYNKNSLWAKKQTDTNVIKKADSLAQNHLYDAAVSYHQLALQKNDTLSYSMAAENYEEFIRNYPLSPKAGECHYNLAEIQFSLGNYERAAEEYMAVSKRYPDSKYRETAAWNAIVAAQNLLKKEEGTSR